MEHNASGSLIDFLAAGPRRANEWFVEVFLPNAQRLYALEEFLFFFR